MTTAKKSTERKYHLYMPEDISKNWHISWRVDGKRIRKYGNVNRGETKKERLVLIHQLLSDLKTGRVGRKQVIELKSKKRLNAIEFKLYMPEDLSKNWHISWRSNGKRFKKYGNVNKGKTAEERTKLIHKLLRKLKRENVAQHYIIGDKLHEIMSDNETYWRPKTCERHRTTINLLLKFAEGYRIDEVLIADFFRMLKKTRHSTTYNNYRSSLRTLFREAGYLELIKNIPKLKTAMTPARYFQGLQAKRLKSLINKEDPDLSLFIDFMYFCFIRPKELRGLRAGDILLEDEKIRMPGNVSKTHQTQYVTIPKAFINKLDFVRRLEHDDYIFPNERDRSKPLPENQMYNRHLKFLKELDLKGKGYTLYSWRHTGAVAVAKRGIPLKQLQVQMRHHSLDQTDQYLRQMGVRDLKELKEDFPVIWR